MVKRVFVSSKKHEKLQVVFSIVGLDGTMSTMEIDVKPYKGAEKVSGMNISTQVDVYCQSLKDTVPGHIAALQDHITMAVPEIHFKDEVIVADETVEHGKPRIWDEDSSKTLLAFVEANSALGVHTKNRKWWQNLADEINNTKLVHFQVTWETARARWKKLLSNYNKELERGNRSDRSLYFEIIRDIVAGKPHNILADRAPSPYETTTLSPLPTTDPITTDPLTATNTTSSAPTTRIKMGTKHCWKTASAEMERDWTKHVDHQNQFTNSKMDYLVKTSSFQQKLLDIRTEELHLKKRKLEIQSEFAKEMHQDRVNRKQDRILRTRLIQELVALEEKKVQILSKLVNKQ